MFRSENLYIIPIGILCFLLLFIFYIVTQYVRDKIFNSKEYVLKSLILIQYLLLGYVIFSAISLPYQLNESGLFGKLSISRVMFDTNIYKTHIFTFILISLTAFSSIRKSLKESVKSYLIFTVVSALGVIVLYQINHAIFSIEKTSAEGLIYYVDTKQKQLNEIFICVLPTLIWIYFIARFKINKTTIIKNYLYNYVPIIVWYVVFAFIMMKPFLLSKEEIKHLLNVLGAFG